MDSSVLPPLSQEEVKSPNHTMSTQILFEFHFEASLQHQTYKECHSLPCSGAAPSSTVTSGPHLLNTILEIPWYLLYPLLTFSYVHKG